MMGELEKLRYDIDKIDMNISYLLMDRLKVCQLIGQHKKKYNIPIEDLQRFDKLLEIRIKDFVDMGYNENMIIDIYTIIHKYCKDVQL
jgi:shikimate dehydrogenase